MTNNDPVAQIRERFERPLDDFAKRRIVFWHDADGSFEQEFAALSEESFDGPRKVRLARADENAFFSLKRAVCRQHQEDDFLIYTRSPKDFSPHALDGNWLADVELVAEHFQADFASMLMEELGATDSAVDGVEFFKAFFNAADRRERFKRLMPHAQSKQDVTLAVIGAIIGAGDLSTETIVRTYLAALGSGDDPISSLGKYGADAPFASFISKRIGYTGDLSSADDMAAHLLITALSFQLHEGALSGLEDRVSEPHGQFCLNIVHAWMADESAASALYGLCRKVEESCGLPARFEQMGASQLVEADVFPCINERILADLLASMAQGADRSEEAVAISQRRRDLRWFSRVEPYFKALEQAAQMQRFYRAHLQGFHCALPTEAWKAYVTDWYRMDSFYRGFCKAASACSITASDLPNSVHDGLDELASWVERIYVYWFLSEANACWVSSAEHAWEHSGYVEGVPRQRRFFDEFVLAGASEVKKTMIIVSDALRYEVASELCTRLEQDTTGSAKLQSMQATFPSITEFGMAALLPHTSMQYREADGGVYLDGSLPTSSTEEREAVLRLRKPKSSCLRSRNLVNARRAERKELLGDAEFVFVYHNKIDAMGEDFNTEHMVFKACDETIDDIVALVKMAANDLGISRVIVTSDHGFLYTRRPLDEKDKVSKKDACGNVVKQGRRYMISDEVGFDDPVFIKMNMDDIDGGTYTGLAPRECVRIKKAGPGDNYVHGGVSLQECCVPVIQYRNKRAGSKNYEERSHASFTLLSTTRRITSMLFRIELFQSEPVGGKVLPAEYELVMVDSLGNEVSDVHRAHADMETHDETSRVRKVQFGLKAGMQYDSKKGYFLVCKNKQTGAMWREEFQIDVSFVPMDDFGF